MTFMKKTVLALLAVFIMTKTASAQLYLNLVMGYAVCQAGETYDWRGTPYNGTRTGFTNGNYTYSIKNASFSAGLQGTVGIGYMLSENIGIQLDALIGISNKKYKFNDDSIALSNGTSSIPGMETVTQQAKTPFILMPSFVVQTGGDPINLYCRLGLALPLNTKVNMDEYVTNYPGAGAVTPEDYTYQIKSSFSLGFTAAAGLQYKISDKVRIWGEMSILSLSVLTRESDLKSLNAFDGTQWQSVPIVPANVPYTGPQVIKYSKNATIDSTGAQLPAYSQPFSNVAFNAGVTFLLSEKKARQSKHHIKSDNARLREQRDF
jgi:opacity protein-like surface antigen